MVFVEKLKKKKISECPFLCRANTDRIVLPYQYFQQSTVANNLWHYCPESNQQYQVGNSQHLLTEDKAPSSSPGGLAPTYGKETVNEKGHC